MTRPFALVATLLLLWTQASAVEQRARTISRSKQFVIFCQDAAVRGRVASVAEDIKEDLLQLLGERDRAKAPIVITLQAAPTPAAARTPVALLFQSTPQGTQIEINVQIGDDPAAVHLQKHIVRALLLELAYRNRPLHGGEEYVEAPWWLVAGVVESFRRHDLGLDEELFHRLVETNRLPPIEQFLAPRPDDLGGAAAAVDGACAMALIELLLEQPAGRDRLARLVREWPDLHHDSIAALRRIFPALAEGDVQKWWTLNLARFAASDRYKGLSTAATDRELDELLDVELPVDKAGTKQTFNVGEFESFLKLRGARAALAARHAAIVNLSARANAIFRPVVNGYEQVLAQLKRGKTRGVRKHIVEIEVYREAVLHRIVEIGDYLNWYEATQLGVRSHAFDSFLRTAREVEQDQTRAAASEEIARYLDELQKNF